MRSTRFFSGRKGTVFAIMVLAMVAVLAAYLDPSEPVTGSARVSDGDSFRIGQEKIRLLGIDAPELRQTCLDEDRQPWPCGTAARNRMAELLKQGEVRCQPDGTDRYGRTLAHCTTSQQDLGSVMVTEGLAIASGQYWAEEGTARNAKAGIWKGGFDTPREWRQDHTGIVDGWSWLSFLRR